MAEWTKGNRPTDNGMYYVTVQDGRYKRRLTALLYDRGEWATKKAWNRRILAWMPVEDSPDRYPGVYDGD